MFEIKIAVTLILALACFAWGLYLHRQNKASKTTRGLTWILIAWVALLFGGWVKTAFPGDRTTHYSRDGSRTGYSIREGDRESHFSSSGKRKGYSIHRENKTDNYDPDWNREGRDETRADEDPYIWTFEEGEN